MDRTYEDNETRQLALDFGFIPVVPPKSNRLEPWQYSKDAESFSSYPCLAAATSLALFAARVADRGLHAILKSMACSSDWAVCS
jgi:hypothetical protein